MDKLGKIEWSEQLGLQQVLGVLARDEPHGAKLMSGISLTVRFEVAQVVIRTSDHWVAHLMVEPVYGASLDAYAKVSNKALEQVAELLRRYGFQVRLGETPALKPVSDS